MFYRDVIAGVIEYQVILSPPDSHIKEHFILKLVPALQEGKFINLHFLSLSLHLNEKFCLPQ